MVKAYNVEGRFWDPLSRVRGLEHEWTVCNTGPLSKEEAEAMLWELGECLSPEYRGQGQALHALRLVELS